MQYEKSLRLNGIAVFIFLSLLVGVTNLRHDLKPGRRSLIVYLHDQPFSRIAESVKGDYVPLLEELQKSIVKKKKLWNECHDPLVAQELVSLDNRFHLLKGKMRREMFNRVRNLIDGQQNEICSYIKSLGGKISYKYTIVNAVSCVVPDESIEKLKKHHLVEKVLNDVKLIGHLNTSTHSILVDTFWNNGYTGGPNTGPWCAVIDCGIDWTHPALSSFTHYDSVFHASAQYQSDYSDVPTSTDDFQGHGTHVAGIIWSKGSSGWTNYKGVAYGDNHCINAKAGYRNIYGYPRMMWSDAMAAVEWAVNAPGIWADVINFSYGTDPVSYDDSSFARFWDSVVYDEWVTVCVSAGNDGPGSYTLGEPAISYNVLTVGAVFDRDNTNRQDDSVASYSSRGPTIGGRKNPRSLPLAARHPLCIR